MGVYRRIVVIIALISSIYMLNIVIEYYYGNNADEKLIEVFQESTFKIDEVKLNIWGEYRPKYMTDLEMKNLIETIVNQLSLQNYESSFEESDSKREYRIEKQGSEAAIKIVLLETIESLNASTFQARNYIMVDLELSSQCESIYHFESIIKEAFDRLQTEPIVNLQVVASQDGNIGAEQAKNLMTELMVGLNGKICGNNDSGEAVGIYGYSKDIKQFVKSNKERVNIDIAMTYNEAENKSYLYAAIPVITTEY